jgi:hypothetical protein
MKASLRALLSEVIDYAGLFPPAKLPLDQAVRNYARYRTEPEAWMLGRFICPAARLAELSPFVGELFASGPPVAVSALGRGGDTVEALRAGLLDDFQAIAAFRWRHGGRATVDVLEFKLPQRAGSTAFQGIGWDWEASEEDLDGGMPRLFYEVGFAGDWRTALRDVLDLERAGFKLRCGGLEAKAFPTAEQVAHVIAECARARRPFKATAGLHHPLRRPDGQLGVTMHGFLNVFGAGVLAALHGLDEGQVCQIIEDEDPSHFAFDDTAFRWRDLSVPTEAIAQARHVFTSFGSCSFDEPRDDLRALGLL